MPQRFRKLRINRVDLVDLGANQEAWVRLYKAKEGAPVPKDVEKAATFADTLLAIEMPDLQEQVYDLLYALSDTITCALYDVNITDKGTAIRQAVADFSSTLDSEIAQWLGAAATTSKRALGPVVQATVVAKVGQKISASNMKKLKAAVEYLQDLMAQHKPYSANEEEGDVSVKKSARPDLTGVAKAVVDYLDSVEQRATALEAEVAALRPAEQVEAEVLKSLPEAARRLVEKARADQAADRARIVEIEKREKDAADKVRREKYITKAGSLQALGVKADDLGPALAKLAEADEAAVTLVVKAMEAANGVLAANNLLVKEVGHSGGQPAGTGEGGADSESAQERVIAKAKTLVAKAEGGKLTLGAAIKKVLADDPALYQEYRDETTVYLKPGKKAKA